MPDFLSISLKGDSIGLPDLADALGDFTTVLGEVEREVTGRRDIQWRVSGLERASATVSVTPIQPPGTLLDQRGEVIGSLVGGLQRLVASPDRPPHFNDRTLQSASSKCICDPETFDAIRLLLGKRVLVYGEIGYSKTGEPTTIRVERFESLRTTDVLPQAGEVRGIYADSPVSASDHADFLREH